MGAAHFCPARPRAGTAAMRGIPSDQRRGVNPESPLPVPVAQEDLKAKRRTKRMTRMAASIYFATILLPVAAIAAPKDGACGVGTLIDVQANVEVTQAGAIEHGRETVNKNGRREYDSY